MLPARLLRTSARNAFKQCLANPRPRALFSPSLDRIQRDFCLPQPVQKQPPGAAPKPASKTERDMKGNSGHDDPSKSASPSKPDTVVSSVPSSETEASKEQKQNIPDIPSTSWSSIGFEEQDAKDPNKWKKFAWKYAGAVLLFLISYKTLHWYTDRLEADGKRRRKEMEEDREIAKDILNSEPSSSQGFPFLERPQEAPQLPTTTSELDELYAYKSELEGTLQALRSQSKTPEIRVQTKDTQAELKELADEIKVLEAKGGS